MQAVPCKLPRPNERRASVECKNAAAAAVDDDT